MERAGRSFRRGLGGLRDPGTAVLVLGLGLLSWLLVAVSYWLALIGLDIGLGFAAAVLVLVATSFAFALPSLPAAVGTFEAATLAALHPFGVDDSRALSCAVVLHVLTFVPFLAIGPPLLHRHGFGLRDAPGLASRETQSEPGVGG